MEVDQIKFQREVLFSCIRLSPDFLQNMTLVLENREDITDMADYVARSLVLNFRAYLFGRNYEKYETEYPDGAWQFFKKDHMPKWFIKKFPVRYKKIIGNYTQVLTNKCIPLHEPSVFLARGFNHI